MARNRMAPGGTNRARADRMKKRGFRRRVGSTSLLFLTDIFIGCTSSQSRSQTGTGGRVGTGGVALSTGGGAGSLGDGIGGTNSGGAGSGGVDSRSAGGS